MSAASPKNALLFIPTYNERENIELLYGQLRAQELGLDLLLLDDNSPDGTGEVIDEIAARDSRVSVIHRAGKLGIGSAHQEGIRWAYDKGYQVLVTMDADFTHSPADVPRLLEASDANDAVVGSRYMLKNSLEGWNPVRKMLTWIAHALTTHLLHLQYDSTGAFRVYRLHRIPRELFDLVRSSGYSFFFEVLYLLNVNGFKIAEIPIRLPPRTYGHSKMSYAEVARSVRLLFQMYLRRLLKSDSMRLARTASGSAEGKATTYPLGDKRRAR